MSSLSDFLDADWAQLVKLSNTNSRPRNLWNSFSPRFAPVLIVRIAQYLHSLGWLRLAKFSALINFILFGIEVPPQLSIGPGLVLMHTQGTVLGAASIGANVTIYHQVTLGAAVIDFEYTLSLRPVVADEVIVGAGAKVLGGLTLGYGSRVGANAVVLGEVPSGHVAVGVPAKILPPKSERNHSLILKSKV